MGVGQGRGGRSQNSKGLFSDHNQLGVVEFGCDSSVSALLYELITITMSEATKLVAGT